MTINIPTSLNGVGLQNDANILKDILESTGHEVTISNIKVRPSGKQYDVVIFLEILSRIHGNGAKRKIFIPNPEWFEASWYRSELHIIDEVWTKTDHATDIFQRIKGNKWYEAKKIGFTSIDRYMEGVPQVNGVFHLCGRSSMKNTQTVLDTWKRYGNELPHLTCIMHDQRGLETRAIPNATIIKKRISDEGLLHLMNSHKIHLCPSQAEGWGHYIVEAMSTGATVITTDASPMNDIVTSERGVLIPCRMGREIRRYPQVVVKAAEVTPEDILRGIREAEISHEEKGKKAMDWYLQNDDEFRKKIIKAIHDG